MDSVQKWEGMHKDPEGCWELRLPDEPQSRELGGGRKAGSLSRGSNHRELEHPVYSSSPGAWGEVEPHFARTL